MQALDRARGALYGLAIGDALGMPTQLLPRAEVVARWGPLLPGFEAAPPGHPIADGMPAGSVTDDTEQAVLLGRLLVRGNGQVDPHEWAAELVNWEKGMAARGSLDLLGPSTKRALLAVQSGTPPRDAGRHGDTNGAAMRITPVGIATGLPGLAVPVITPALVERVHAACLVTHNTPVAVAGAAAVAAAVSAGIWGASPRQAILGAIAAARVALRTSPTLPIPAAPSISPAPSTSLTSSTRPTSPTSSPSLTLSTSSVSPSTSANPFTSFTPSIPIAPLGSGASGVDTRIWQAVSGARGLAPEQAASFIVAEVGTSLATTESVPAAFAVLSAVPDDPWQACLLAASLGGDSDTIAAMAGAVAGACHGMSAFPEHAIAVIDAHGLGLTELADALYALRRP